MLWPVVKALLGHYKRHPLQLLLVWLGLTLGISIFVGVEAVNQHARESYTEGERLFSNPLPYRIRPKNNANKIPQGLYIQLRREGFHQCVPLDIMQIETSEGRDFSVLGLDSVATLDLAGIRNLADYLNMDMLRPPYPIMLSKELAAFLDKGNGDYIELIDNSLLGPIVIDSKGLISGTRIITDIAKLRMINKAGGFSAINCGAMPQPKFEQLKRILPNGVTITRSSQTELKSLTKAFHMNLSAMGMLAFLVGLFIFYQAMSLSFVQRQPLVGILRQTGVTTALLVRATVLELCALVVFSWLSGNVFGLILANQLIPTVSTTLADLYNANVGLTISWSWEWSRTSLLMAVVGTFIACSWPALRLVKAPPIRLSARLSLIRLAGTEFALQALVACALFAFASLLYYKIPHTPERGFALVALLMVGTALLLPFAIYKLFNRFSYSLRWVKVRWFFADAATSMSYRGVATMAFMLAMSANIAVETLVGSFRETTDKWLTQRLAADLYIYPSNSSAARVSNWLTTQEEVKAVWWRWEEELTSDSGTLQIVSSGSTTGEREAVTPKLAIPDYWYHLHNSRSVMISESMALKEDIRPGDYVNIPGQLGDDWQVAGVYYDYGNPYNQILMSHRNWLGLFSGRGNVGLGVHLNDEAQAAPIIKRLSSYYHLSADRIFDNTNIHNQAMRVFDRTFIIADTLGNLTLVIAVFGIFFATVAGEVSKQRQVALLRCLGISGKELVALSSLQLLMLGFLSALVALPLGFVIANVMLDVVLKLAFGWSMQLYVIPWQYMETFAWTMLALLAAGAIPVIGMVKRTPMKSLRDAL
ncbi:FtsX-like permease family protein [Vibrio sp. JC009]|uniref:ABC transporter permease n=1 Tax=Vibrio sp. JC009 TaxID=2912314 RepID=UPI0023AEC7F6|nr:FtsX-like permease family protein [Vibrio sp. JC009]WED22988.1 FtsX-like permease family protein [Vibrio sp. JC009]